jgi:protein-S-isoprenylcysteine O-methyltransferase Ste14
MKFMPPGHFALALMLSLAPHYVAPGPRLFSVPTQLLGLPLIALGAWFTLWADAVFKRRQTTVKPFETPSTLVEEGPFRFSRHPMYVGMTLVLLGVAIYLGTAAAFLGPVAFFLILALGFVPIEEQKMHETFGDTYDRYARRVRRWL